MTCRIRYFQPGFFAIPVGIGGLSIAYLRLAELFPYLKSIGLGLAWLSFISLIVIAILYLAKIVFFKQEFLKDINNPIKLSMLPLFSIALLIDSISFGILKCNFALPLAIAGTMIHLLFTYFNLRTWITKDLHLSTITPTWYIPIVGNILVPITPINQILGIFNWFFFSIGIIFWIILTTILFYRKFFHEPLPEALLPSLFILLAPPSVGFISYIKITHSLDSIANILYFTALAFLLLLVTLIDRFVKIRFKLTWWAYIFPIDALTIATILYYHLTKMPLFIDLAIAIESLATILLTIVGIKTLIAIKKGEICKEE